MDTPYLIIRDPLIRHDNDSDSQYSEEEKKNLAEIDSRYILHWNYRFQGIKNCSRYVYNA